MSGKAAGKGGKAGKKVLTSKDKKA